MDGRSNGGNGSEAGKAPSSPRRLDCNLDVKMPEDLLADIDAQVSHEANSEPEVNRSSWVRRACRYYLAHQRRKRNRSV